MRIVVLVKEVPDTYGERTLNLETGLADRGATEAVLDEISERAVEAALRLADTQATDVQIDVMSMSPESALPSIRKGLAMGAHEAVHIADESLAGADVTLTAEVLAAAIQQRGYDLVVCGNVATDGNGGVIPSMIAEHLDLPQLTGLTNIASDGSSVTGERDDDFGTAHLTAELPAVVSITESFPDARFPNFKGIMAAKKKPLTTLTCADLGIDPEDFSTPRSIMTEVSQTPPREAGTKIVDDGTAVDQLVTFLSTNKLI
ncbi:electron transfer flavoprotein subunit beta/FixA family protein [Corynebacterium breve]|uniref:Electron transfer flavoprotein subunit beta n=1 Tax=Corynebacterium breve TaxID=3049799 RepID=A0ABY8VFH5_9CORY|nr:electron transfer flavoprotein subunit beta/FixA family protein [Corynebacterium breve]WIM68401.1 electron transfer flavoprotein subunit beta/FixA family protein [Corynebacterium breve]